VNSALAIVPPKPANLSNLINPRLSVFICGPLLASEHLSPNITARLNESVRKIAFPNPAQRLLDLNN
jgi:hypothetical protein